jgi:predicted nucleic acid-binding protein
MARLRVLLDLNVILDVLGRRESFYAASAKVWESVEVGRVEGILAAHSITTLFYLLSKHKTRQEALNIIRSMLSIFKVATVDQGIILQALALGWLDFEDAVQAVAAASCGAVYIITRNVPDYKNCPISIYSPSDFLTYLQGSEG